MARTRRYISRSTDEDTTGGGGRKALYALVDVSDPSSRNKVYLLTVDVAEGVVVNWYDRLLDTLARKANGDEKLSGMYNPYDSWKQGRAVLLSFRDEDDHFGLVREVADEAIVAVPQIDFQVVSTDNDDGTTTTRVYYNGAQSGSGLKLPKTSDGIHVQHGRGHKVVTVTTVNPLYVVSDDLVAQIKSALQANAVPETVQQ
jgi:hypothetical protein